MYAVVAAVAPVWLVAVRVARVAVFREKFDRRSEEL